ncbi:MAG: RDD family protein [Planctomycetia bacterium]|nr:RDD family protein [Planctomycetia bacterium]
MKKYEQLDTLVSIITPENIRFTYRLAGPSLRLFAFMIDVYILAAVIIILFLLGCAADSLILSYWDLDLHAYIRGVGFVLYALLFWFWTAFWEWKRHGISFGKQYFRLRVLTLDGQPITGMQALIRNILRAADLALGPLALYLMGSNSRFMRLGDIAAGTLVVCDIKTEEKDPFKFGNPAIINLAERIPPDFVISKSLSKALVLYVRARGRLSAERRWEICSPLAHRLMKSLGFSPATDPDLFLCALYQSELNSENS